MGKGLKRASHSRTRSTSERTPKFTKSTARVKKVVIVPGFTRQVGYMPSAPGFSGKKFLDTNVVAVSPSTTGTILNGGTLCVIPQGITKSTRVGNDCIIQNLNLHGRILLPKINVLAVAPLLPSVFAQDRLRMIVYIDTQANGLPATALDILAVQPGGGTASIDSFRNYDNLSRFRILKDKVFVLNSTAAGGMFDPGTTGNIVCASGMSKELRMGFKLNLAMYFDADTGAMGTIRSNNIGILCLSDNAQASIEFISRVKYIDP